MEVATRMYQRFPHHRLERPDQVSLLVGAAQATELQQATFKAILTETYIQRHFSVVRVRYKPLSWSSRIPGWP